MRNFVFGLSLFLILSCSDDKDDTPQKQQEKPAPGILAKDPIELPVQRRKHCLPLPKGWPNPWPCLPKATPIEPMPLSVLGQALNKERQANGLSLLSEDKKLSCAASAEALRLAQKKTCSHTDAASFSKRLIECGFTVNGQSEVIACGHGSAMDALDAMLQSQNHRALLLKKEQQRLGVSQVGGYFVVVLSP